MLAILFGFPLAKVHFYLTVDGGNSISDFTRLNTEFYKTFMLSNNKTYNVAEILKSTEPIPLLDIVMFCMIVVGFWIITTSQMFRLIVMLQPPLLLTFAANKLLAITHESLIISSSGTIHKCIQWSTILNKYLKIQRISITINSIFGLLLFWTAIDYVTWLATDLDLSIKSVSWFNCISSVWIVIFSGLPLVISAEFVRKVKWTVILQ